MRKCNENSIHLAAHCLKLLTAFAYVSFVLFFSAKAHAADQEASALWGATAARLSENAGAPITFGSGFGAFLDYGGRFTENLRVGVGYSASANASSLILHGPNATLRYTLFGGRSHRMGGAMQTYTLERPFEISVPLGASVQFYDLRSIVKVDGLRKKEATRLEGSAYSFLTGLEAEFPIQTDLKVRLGLRISIGKLTETQGNLNQLQTIIGIEKVL